MINKLIVYLKKDQIVNAMILVSFGSVISTFVSYYFNFYIQSIFPSFSDYSDFVFMITFLAILLLVPAAISSSLSLLVTELKVKNKFKELTMLYLRMNLLFGSLGLLLGGLTYILRDQISYNFNINNSYIIPAISIITFLSIVSTPCGSYLYGLLRFKSFVFLSLFSMISKLFAVITFFHLGFGFISIPYGLIVSYVLSLVLGNFFLIKSLDFEFKGVLVRGLTKQVLFFSLPLFFIFTGNGMLTQVDFLVIKSKFLSEVSGQYALLINIGKMFLFGSFIFLGAMSSQITEAYNKKEGYFKILFFYAKILLVIVFCGLCALGIFPKQFLGIFIYISSHLGLSLSSLNLYYSVVDLIPLYTVFISLVIIINFLVLFLVATSTTRIYASFIFTVLLQFLSIKYFSFDLYSAIICNIITASILLFYLLFEVYKKYEGINNSSRL